MEVMVVTGGIGSGKSLVCSMLQEMYGLPVYKADSRVKELYDEHPFLLDSISGTLGLELRDSEGRFVPSRLSERIFSDSNALEDVENLVFPVLKDDFRRFADSHSAGAPVVFESATVLEKKQFDGFGDFVLLVDAPSELRIFRASVRDGVSRKSVAGRMSHQKLMNALSEGAVDERVSYVILNDGSVSQLRQKVEKMMKDCFNISVL